jgi:hypothetical protein
MSQDWQTPDRRSEPRDTPDRRRGSWAEFRAAYPGLVVTMTIAIVVLLVGIAALLVKRSRYESEIARLRADMTEVERNRADAILADEERRFGVMMALLRRQAKLDERLHLAVEVDSGRLVLQRDGAVLRTVRVEFGAEVPDSAVTVADDGSRADSGASIPEGRPLAAPRGSRTVERVYAPGEQYPVPSWMREVRAGLPEGLALDDGLLLLNGGEVIYAAPDEGALAAPAPVLPGAVRIPIEDFRSMLANLSPGMTVYFY